MRNSPCKIITMCKRYVCCKQICKKISIKTLNTKPAYVIGSGEGISGRKLNNQYLAEGETFLART